MTLWLLTLCACSEGVSDLAVITQFVLQIHDDGQVTAAGVETREQHAQAVSTVQAAVPGSTVVQDPWQTQGSQAHEQTAAARPVPSCPHGPLKLVPGGVSGPNSRNPGRAYGPFWACQAPQGMPKCRLDKNSLPPAQ